MKRLVVVMFEIDPDDYDNVEDSADSLIDEEYEMLSGRADLPDEVSITCLGKNRKVKVYG